MGAFWWRRGIFAAYILGKRDVSLLPAVHPLRCCKSARATLKNLQISLFSLPTLALPFLFLSSTASAVSGYFEPWGKDAGLKKVSPPSAETIPVSLATQIADRVIRFHQEVISPVDGPRSHFRPSSSRYMQLAMQRYGFLKGYIMGCDRLLRENDEEWVYRKIEIEGRLFKYDPAKANKYE